MKILVSVIIGQPVEEEIGPPRYLIGETGEGAVRLSPEPEKTSSPATAHLSP